MQRRAALLGVFDESTSFASDFEKCNFQELFINNIKTNQSGQSLCLFLVFRKTRSCSVVVVVVVIGS